MKKTNEETRGNLAHKYNDEFKKLNQTVDLLTESGYSKEEINATRERLIKNLETKLSEEEGYEESKKSHRAEHKAKKEYQKAQEAYTDSQQTYNNAQINYRGKVRDLKEELFGDKIGILYFLKKNVKVEENVEMMGYKGKKVYINLPAVGEFKGFKFEYFVSNQSVKEKDFENNSKLKKESYSMEDVWELLKAMNEYIKAMGIKDYYHMNYQNDLEERKNGKGYSCNAGDYLKDISGLDGKYWLKDKIITRKGTSYAAWDCEYGCRFSKPDNAYDQIYLFLRLSD